MRAITIVQGIRTGVLLLALMAAGWVRAQDGRPAPAAPDTTPAIGQRPAAGQPPDWRHVMPVLAARCMSCHIAEGRMGPPPEGYRLDSWEEAVSARDRARIVPGLPAASELVRRVKGHARPRMPFDGPPWLHPDDIRLIEDWIARGARDGQGRPAPIPAGARVRLRGTLSADGTLDGLPLDTRGVRADRLPRPGGEVELRARVAADGGLVTERLRGRGRN